jgi:alpha-L-rhamnosidase
MQNVETVTFRRAVAVWPAGRERVMNDFVGFRAVVTDKPAGPVTVRLTCSTFYRLSVNGEFVAHGPVRAAHGHFRVDEWDVTPRLRAGANVIAIEVAGYNVDSYYTLDQPSFLQAEVVGGDTVLAATAVDGGGFTAIDLPERVRKAERYSFQRAFSEVYRLQPEWDRWRREAGAVVPSVKLAAQPEVPLLPRRIDKPTFDVVRPTKVVAHARMEKGTPPEKPRKFWGLTSIGPQHKGYTEGEIETLPSIDVQAFKGATTPADEPPAPQQKLGQGDGVVFDLGRNLTGFVGGTVTCTTATRLVFTFDELLTKGDVDHGRLGCASLITYDLEPGTYAIESIEPYTMRYLKASAWSGTCDLGAVFVREYASPAGTGTVAAAFASSDERLDRIFTAALHTYRQNAADVFMDCPSRERAGWLCDSFWTARVAFDLAGHALDEKNFIENFLLPAKFAHIPDGMLPMCYPADHYNANFIPQWAMWFVVELREYLHRSGDRALVDALQPRVRALLTYLDTFANADGLLENLPGWKFVEWSKANDFVDGVNYPTNMLYAGALAAAGEMYDDAALADRHARMLETVRKQSFDGDFFVDQAQRENGAPARTTNRTEVCQYYAFFFDAATPDSHAELWKKLTTDFGQQRKETKAFPDIHPANAFIGNYLRCALLARYDLTRRLKDEIVGYFLKMADLTGTLWENDNPHASCDHGFASHVAHWLYRDLLGAHVDPRGKVLTLVLNDCGLTRCEGTLACGPDHPGHVRWQVDGDVIGYETIVPDGWSVKVENRTKLRAVQKTKW